MKRYKFRHMRIGMRLPLLICGILLSVILIFGIISYVGVREAELRSGKERLSELSNQLGSMFSSNVQSIISETFKKANTPRIISLLNSGKADSSGLKELTDSNFVYLSVINLQRKTIYHQGEENLLPEFQQDSFLNQHLLTRNSAMIGRLYHKRNSIFYPIIASVYDNQKLAGYLIRLKKINVSEHSLKQLSRLMGKDAKIYIVNKDGSVWSDMRGYVAAQVPIIPTNQKTVEYKKQQQSFLASFSKIENSDWLAGIELPKKEVLAAADQFLKWLILAGLLLLLTGIIAVRLLTRSITGPIERLTKAVTNLAAGNYSTFLTIERTDEIGKLSNAYNLMSGQIERMQQALVEEAENYRLLFENNPLPMWIVSKLDLQILEVNKAATDHYGYDYAEFTKLNSADLRPKEDVIKYLDHFKQHNESNSHGIWRHKKKDGTIIMVEVFSDNIWYSEQPAMLVLANDITGKLNAESQLVRHRFMQQRLISETTIQVQESEREEFGRELHDNINQILASTRLYLEIAKSNKENAREAVSRSYDNINIAMAEINRLSKQMVRPAINTSLAEVIRDLSEEIEAITPISVNLSLENFSDDALDDQLKLIIYRIIQEQVNNIIKHAAASNVTITIETSHEMVYLVINDDGVGFDPTHKPKGIGLRNIDNRVRVYNGVVDIGSEPGKGTRLQVVIPMMQKSKLVI